MQVDNSVKNKYDSILKIATHAFTNALIPIVELPDDEYEVISCEIFSPGKDVKSMDILLKGKNGYVNIEFHKQPLSKSQLDRDFEYVVDCYMFYGETVEQRIVVVDNNQKSVEKIDITPKFSYYGNYFYVPDIDGCEVLNNIKNKLENNQELSESEQYIFSILPLTNHRYVDEEQLMKELCALTPKLNISEKNREYINLCHMILVEICVHDEFLKEELYGVISMTTTYIEKRENELKHRAEVAEKDALDAKRKVLDFKERAEVAEKDVLDFKERAEVAEKDALDAKRKVLEANELLKEISDNIDDGGNLNQTTIKKLLSVTSKL